MEDGGCGCGGQCGCTAPAPTVPRRRWPEIASKPAKRGALGLQARRVAAAMADPDAYAEMIAGLGAPAAQRRGLRLDGKGRIVPGRVRLGDEAWMVADLDDDEIATFSSFTVDPNMEEARPERRQGCGTAGIAGLATVDLGALKEALRSRVLRDRGTRRAPVSDGSAGAAGGVLGVDEGTGASQTDRRAVGAPSAIAAAPAGPGAIAAGMLGRNGSAPLHGGLNATARAA